MAARALQPTFQLTSKQLEAMGLVSGEARHCMLFGGSRSGKTFLHVRNVVMRAMKAPGSRHLIVRFRFNHLKASIVHDTFPRVMALCFAGVKYELSRTDWFVKFPNGSEIWFAGLDDRERTEKILGQEYSTVYLNECSQISNDARQMVLTRLAQLAMQVMQGRPPVPMKLRAFYDCNPPSKAHWTFRIFRQKVDPETREPLAKPGEYVSMQINPKDNQANLSSEYLASLGDLSARMRRRFEYGEFADATQNALFDEACIDRWRLDESEVVPQLIRVVVGVDPSGSGDEDNADNDEIGVVVAGLGVDGKAYVLEDVTVKAGPATWGAVAVSAWERHKADVVVGETNFGGDMVRHVIQTARSKTPFRKVVASRGKCARAEPFSALYEQGKIRHVGVLSKLEDELCAMSTVGYVGPGSPNRADALIWALADLFPGIIAGPKTEKPKRERHERLAGSWMA